MNFKVFLILTILSLSSCGLAQTLETILNGNAVTRGEMVKFMIKNANVCRQRTGASFFDVLEAAQQKPASTRKGKCMRACVMDALALYDANNKFNVPQAKKFVHALRDGFGDEGVKLAHEVIDICAGIEVPPKKCDSVGIYAKCFKQEGDKRNINIFHMKPGELPGADK